MIFRYLMLAMIGVLSLLSCSTKEMMRVNISSADSRNVLFMREYFTEEGFFQVDTISVVELKEKNGVLKLKVDEPYIMVAFNGSSRVDFIAERCELNLKLGSNSGIAGGVLNSRIIDAELKDNEFNNAKKIFEEFVEKTRNLPIGQQKESQKEGLMLLNNIHKAKNDVYTNLFNNSPSAIEKALILSYGGFASSSEHFILLANEVIKELPCGYNRMKLANSVEYNKNSIKKRILLAVGGKFIDFETQDINDKKYQLSDVVKRNKYTLLEFWASWCAPCRREFPYLRDDYKKYKAKGFEIFSFNFDTKVEDWKNASEKESINWIDCGDLADIGRSEVAKKYNITGVPTSFLIDQNGVIVAKNLRGKALDEKLSELFNR